MKLIDADKRDLGTGLYNESQVAAINKYLDEQQEVINIGHEKEKITEQLLRMADEAEQEAEAEADCSSYYEGVAEGITSVIELMKVEVRNGWIPVKERIPEVFDNVLVCTKEGGRTIAHRCPNQAHGRYYDLHSSPIDNIIAWQPLPEPYRPEEGE